MANPMVHGGVGSPQSIYQAVSSPEHTLGTRGVLDDRVFYYAKAGASNLARCLVNVKPAAVANHQSCAWQAGGAIGTDNVTITLGATLVTENQYKDGWLSVHDGTGSGTLRKIKSHPAADASATLKVTLYDNFTIASVTADEISLVKNVYDGTIVTPGNALTFVVGVPQEAVTAAYYYWAQTWGPGFVQGDATTFIAGGDVVPATAGTGDTGQVTIVVETGTAANSGPVIGRTIDIGDAASDLDYRLVDFRIKA